MADHLRSPPLRWLDRLKGTKCLNMVKRDQLCAIALMKIGFTQNGCYGNQPRPLETLFDSSNANNSCSFTKQDLIFKQAYLVGLCVVLFNKLKF